MFQWHCQMRTPMSHISMSPPPSRSSLQVRILLMVDEAGGSSVLSWIVVLGIILLVMLGLRYLYVIWRRRKNRAEIEFEMSESNRQVNETVTNNNRGYGDFIDEAQ